MTIYTFQKVEDFLKSLNMDNIYHNKREYHLKKYYPDIYSKIIDKTNFTKAGTFTEKLFCYANNITSIPLCKLCGKNTVYRTNRYTTYCSNKCSIKSIPTILGVDNASQLQSIKNKKKEKSLEKYGVDNVSKAAIVKNIIRNKTKDRWDKIYNNKNFSSENLTREQYRRRANQYANTQYNRYISEIDPKKMRSNEWHVDHIYSITDGFLNNVPINIISDITNLRLIRSTDNYKKHQKSEKTLHKLIEDYNTRNN